ncbi:uncharacterized protein LOC144053990 isoform X4 [Vanacampus margaritifer]
MYNAPARLLLVCILLCAQQRSAPAYVWQGTQRGQLSVSDYLPGSSPCPATPPASPRSKHDAAADLSHAEADETGNRHVQPRHRSPAAPSRTGNASRAASDSSAV